MNHEDSVQNKGNEGLCAADKEHNNNDKWQRGGIHLSLTRSVQRLPVSASLLDLLHYTQVEYGEDEQWYRVDDQAVEYRIVPVAVRRVLSQRCTVHHGVRHVHRLNHPGHSPELEELGYVVEHGDGGDDHNDAAHFRDGAAAHGSQRETDGYETLSGDEHGQPDGVHLCHADHRPAEHSGVPLMPAEGAGVV